MRGIEMKKAIKGLVALALGAALAGCASAPPSTYDLLVPPAAEALKPLPISLVISEPSAPRAFDTEQIIVRSADGAISYVPGMQWVDRAPVLLQTRLIRAVEKKGYSVAREGVGIIAERQLATEISSFNLVPGDPLHVDLVVTLRLIDTHEGKLVASRAFESHSPVQSMASQDIAAAFDQAIGSLTPTIADWIIARHL
jgi:cholesterol transport system auxiliary component